MCFLLDGSNLCGLIISLAHMWRVSVYYLSYTSESDCVEIRAWGGRGFLLVLNAFIEGKISISHIFGVDSQSAVNLEIEGAAVCSRTSAWPMFFFPSPSFWSHRPPENRPAPQIKFILFLLEQKKKKRGGEPPSPVFKILYPGEEGRLNRL